MTIIIARKIGERILMLADTMISDAEGSRPNIIPGRLKAIVLTPTISVGYAGLANQALDGVRAADKHLRNGGHESEVVGLLADWAAKPLNAGRCDYIVARHNPAPELFSIKNGRVSNDLSIAWIGDPVAFKLLPPVNAAIQTDITDPDLLEESDFTNRFIQLFSKRGSRVSESIGGVPICLLGSPNGHCYQGHQLSSQWEPTNLSTGRLPGFEERAQSGMTAWIYRTIDSPKHRGVAVLGLYLPQVNVGYIYEPLRLQDEETTVHRNISLDGLVERIELAAASNIDGMR